MEKPNANQKEMLLIGCIMERFVKEEKRWPTIEEVRELIDWVHWNGGIPTTVRLADIVREGIRK